MAGDWAKRKVAAIQKAAEETERARESELHRNTRIRGEAPRIWDSLIAMLSENVTEFRELTDSDKLKFHSAIVEEAFISSQDKTLQAVFDSTTPAIVFALSQTTGPTARQAESKGQFVFIYDSVKDEVSLQEPNGPKYSTESAAGHLLDMVI